MKLIFLHGPPAVGKLTVARELARLTGYRVFHNHLTVDLVTALFPFGSTPFVKLREEVWLVAFREAAKSDTSFIFTFAPEKTVRPEFIENTKEVVGLNGGSVIFVQLTCGAQTIEERLASPSRAEFEKLTSLQQYRELKDAGAFDFPIIRSELTLDTTNTPPVETAQAIVRYLRTI